MKKVIDTGAFRSDLLEHFITSSRHNRAVLTDYSILEPSKSNLPFIIRSNIEIISRFPKQVLVLKTTGEIKKLAPSDTVRIEKLIDWKHTKGFPRFCKIVNESSDEDLRLWLSSMREESARKHFEMLEESSKIVKDGIDKLSKVITRSDAESNYEDNPSYSATHLKFIGGVCATSSLNFGKSGQVGCSFKLLINTLQFRYALVCYLLAMRWILKGGFRSAKDSTITNDYTDAMYVAYATIFDGIISRDRKVNELYSRARKWLDFFNSLPLNLLDQIEREWIHYSRQ